MVPTYSELYKKMKEQEERRDLGLSLRRLREKAEISAKDIPDLLRGRGFEIKYSTYMGYENNNSIPNADVFLALCEILRVHDVLRAFGFGNNMFPSFSSAALMPVPYFNLIEDFCNQTIGINTSKKVFDYFFDFGSEANVGAIFFHGKPKLSDEIAVANLLGVGNHDVIYRWGELHGIWEPPLSFPVLSDEEKDFVIALRQLKSQKIQNPQQFSPAVDIVHLRVSTQPVSAGKGAYLGPEEFETLSVVANELTRRAAFAVPVSGNSMEPRYHDGDILLVEKVREVPIGKIGVFSINGEGFVKERGKDVLHSLNPAYDDIPLSDDARCNGLVIGTLLPEWKK